MKDYIPRNPAAFAVWFANFTVQLESIGGKYNVSGDTITNIVRDNNWVQYWVEARQTGKQQEKQLNDYWKDIIKGMLGAPQPSEPTWTLPPNQPVPVPPGIDKRIREVANFIKSQKSIYTIADGELLGIVTGEEAGKNPEDYTPELKLRSLANFALEAAFRLYGLDAIRIEYRHKNGNWQLATMLTSSPGVFNIVPQTAGTAEQIELRGVFIYKNVNFGNFSPIYTEIIQP